MSLKHLLPAYKDTLYIHLRAPIYGARFEKNQEGLWRSGVGGRINSCYQYNSLKFVRVIFLSTTCRNFHLFYNTVSTGTFGTLTLGYQPQVCINTCSLNNINICFVGVEIFNSIIAMVNETSKCCPTPLSSI